MHLLANSRKGKAYFVNEDTSHRKSEDWLENNFTVFYISKLKYNRTFDYAKPRKQ